MNTTTRRFADVFSGNLHFDGNGAFAETPYLAIAGTSTEKPGIPISISIQDLHEQLDLSPEDIRNMVLLVTLYMLMNYSDPDDGSDVCTVSSWAMAHEALVKYCVGHVEIVIQVTAVARKWLDAAKGSDLDPGHMAKLSKMLC